MNEAMDVKFPKDWDSLIEHLESIGWKKIKFMGNMSFTTDNDQDFMNMLEKM